MSHHKEQEDSWAEKARSIGLQADTEGLLIMAYR